MITHFVPAYLSPFSHRAEQFFRNRYLRGRRFMSPNLATSRGLRSCGRGFKLFGRSKTAEHRVEEVLNPPSIVRFVIHLRSDRSNIGPARCLRIFARVPASASVDTNSIAWRSSKIERKIGPSEEDKGSTRLQIA